MLLSAVRSGSPLSIKAEEELVKRFSYLVKASARPYFLCGWDSEDFIQEGMFGLIKAIRDYDEQKSTSFESFAGLCIKRQLYTALRRNLAAKHGPLNDYVSLDMQDGEKSPIPGEAAGPYSDDVLERVILRDEVDRLLNGIEGCLSAFEKKVLGLYLRGLSIGEIARILKKQSKAIDNAIYRIRRKAANLH